MIIVDTHCHAARGWFEPVESLLFQMDRNGVSRAVLVQINGQYDNSYVFESARQHPDRLAVVGLVDPASPTAIADLARLTEDGACGVRLGPEARSPGDDPLAIWRRAAELSLPVSCGGTRASFASDDFARLVAELPSLPIVLEHLGSVNHPDGEEPPYPVRQKVFALARFPNIYMKIPGIGEFAKRAQPVQEPNPFVQPIPPLIDLACAAFGPERLMWGSDFPPVSAREGYGNALCLAVDYLADKPQSARDLIFGETACRVFGLPKS